MVAPEMGPLFLCSTFAGRLTHVACLADRRVSAAVQTGVLAGYL